MSHGATFACNYHSKYICRKITTTLVSALSSQLNLALTPSSHIVNLHALHA